jgi:hypothetical protein
LRKRKGSFGKAKGANVKQKQSVQKGESAALTPLPEGVDLTSLSVFASGKDLEDNYAISCGPMIAYRDSTVLDSAIKHLCTRIGEPFTITLYAQGKNGESIALASAVLVNEVRDDKGKVIPVDRTPQAQVESGKATYWNVRLSHASPIDPSKPQSFNEKRSRTVITQYKRDAQGKILKDSKGKAIVDKEAPPLWDLRIAGFEITNTLIRLFVKGRSPSSWNSSMTKQALAAKEAENAALMRLLLAKGFTQEEIQKALSTSSPEDDKRALAHDKSIAAHAKSKDRGK